MGIPSSLDKLKDKEKVTVLESRIQFQNDTIENQKSQIAELKTQLTQFNEQLDKFSSSIQSQTGIIAEQQRTLKDQETTILEQQMSIADLQKQLVEAQKKWESANTELLDVEKKIRERTENLKNENIKLKTAVDEKERDFNRKVEELQDTIKSLRAKLPLLESKEKELDVLKSKISASDSSSLERRVLDLEAALKDANNTISNLERNLAQSRQQMDNEIKIRELKIEEYEKLIRKEGYAAPTDLNVVFDADSASKVIETIFNRTKSNVMVFLPDIKTLNYLNIDNLRPATRIHLAVPVHQNMDLINQLLSKPNVEIREYTEGQIWAIIRDNEELLLAPIGDNNKPVGSIVKGQVPINIFGNIIRSTWSRLKKI